MSANLSQKNLEGASGRRTTSIHVERSGSIGHSVAPEALPSKHTIEDAEAATSKEHSMTIWEGIKSYPKAIGWSLLFSTAIIMEGYDLSILGSFFISPIFIEQFGTLQADGTKIITAEWQSGLGVAMQSGQIVGLFATGILADRFGFKKVMFGALTWIIGTVFILFFASKLFHLLIGEFLMGFPMGVFQTLSITYATEICPAVLRCYLTTYVNLCWVIGQLLASAVTKGLFETRTDSSLWKIAFALQWMWPVPIMVGVALAPESPWWLVRAGRLEDAKVSIARLASKNSSTNVEETLASIVHTNAMEQEIDGNSGTSYLDCFKGSDLRRTEIACVTWICQSMSGSALMGASAYFYFAAGLPPSQAYTMSLGQYALGICGVLISWVAMSHFGRRTLYIYGLATLCSLMFIVGCISLAPGATDKVSPNVAASWATGSMLLVFTFIYDFSVGPVCYSLVSEMPSTRLRQKTVVLARNAYNICGLGLGFLMPYMLNPKAWNLGGRSGFIWGATGLLCTIWAFWRLPEPKGRTFAELDVLFEKKVSARKFHKTEVDVFHGDDVSEVEVVIEPKH